MLSREYLWKVVQVELSTPSMEAVNYKIKHANSKFVLVAA